MTDKGTLADPQDGISFFRRENPSFVLGGEIWRGSYLHGKAGSVTFSLERLSGEIWGGV